MRSATKINRNSGSVKKNNTTADDPQVKSLILCTALQSIRLDRSQTCFYTISKLLELGRKEKKKLLLHAFNCKSNNGVKGMKEKLNLNSIC